MDSASTESAFTMTPQGDSTPTAGGFTWNPGSTELTFTPAGLLNYGTTYNILIAGIARDQTPQANPLAEPISFAFTTVFLPGTITTVGSSANPSSFP
jgi:hypothetical protein